MLQRSRNLLLGAPQTCSTSVVLTVEGPTTHVIMKIVPEDGDLERVDDTKATIFSYGEPWGDLESSWEL